MKVPVDQFLRHFDPDVYQHRVRLLNMQKGIKVHENHRHIHLDNLEKTPTYRQLGL